ncbi:MAG TPA: glycine--tRNA ligase subunit beta [Granulicella sp.]|jgi:glycyl-tRNA synthetase beta chain|nr:glycine--tRNA ligase subunit beta [Granulicella sp.]
MAEFLFEIGLEEVPARMIAGAQAELERRVVALLERERLVVAGERPADAPAGVKSFSTPRRLAVWVADVAERQKDLSEELLGPSAKIAFKDGVATPAAVAFAKKAGVAVGALRTVETPKGEYLAATSVKPGRAAAEVIAAELPKELAQIYWAKNMYWRPGKPERFVRPVRWLLALLGSDVVPVSFAGYDAGRLSYGHRVLAGAEPVEMASPGDYEAALLKAFVAPDVEGRRHTIRKALDRVCRTIPDARWREDHELVDKLTHLTEWPSVIAGGFDPEYLALPEEVLVTVMRDHQSYFAVEDKSGKLAPHFLAVLNTVADEQGEAVIRHGNERVLRARFNDARFFWEFDQRTPLKERVALLEHVTFQRELGSYAAKTQSIWKCCQRLVGLIEARGLVVNFNAIHDAAILSKTDLTTDLVKEFTELQGQVGGLYARAQGYSEATAAAIYDQYRPVSMEAPVPRTLEGSVLALADKTDTIAGMFGLGLEPTGSKDPFALRRAANGIVKILAESELPLTLRDVAAAASDEGVQARVLGFFAERLEFYLREVRGQAYDVVKAVLAAGAEDVRDAVARAEAVTAVRGSEDFTAVSAAFKRMKNILAQADESGITETRVELPQQATIHPAQSALHSAAVNVGERFARLSTTREYGAALELMATLRPEIDRFFQDVMVMDPDPAVRESRLNLLRSLVQTFSRVADFSEIVTAG